MHRVAGANGFDRALSEGVVIAAMRKITDAQRAALLWLPADGSPRVREGADAPKSGQLYALASKMILPHVVICLARTEPVRLGPGKWAPPAWCITELGLTVRRRLTETPPTAVPFVPTVSACQRRAAGRI